MISHDEQRASSAVLSHNWACTPLQVRLLVCQSGIACNLASCVFLQRDVSYRVSKIEYRKSSIDTYRVISRVSRKKSVSRFVHRFFQKIVSNFFCVKSSTLLQGHVTCTGRRRPKFEFRACRELRFSCDMFELCAQDLRRSSLIP